MKARMMWAVPLAGAGLALGGCQTLSVLGLGHAKSTTQSALAESSPGDQFTQRGRAQLDEGQPGLAIETFRVALALGEPQAPVLNGLGVAMLRIGRADAAQALFAKASDLDPGNARYAGNLERLNSSLVLAGSPVSPLVDGPAVERQVAVAAQVRPGALARTSASEFKINAIPNADPRPVPAVVARSVQTPLPLATPVAQAAPRMASALMASAPVSGNFKPLVRIPLQPSTQPRGSALRAPASRVAQAASMPNGKFAQAFAPLVRMEFGATEQDGRRKVVIIPPAVGRSS